MPEFSVTAQLWPVVCAGEFFMREERLLPGCKSPVCCCFVQCSGCQWSLQREGAVAMGILKAVIVSPFASNCEEAGLTGANSSWGGTAQLCRDAWQMWRLGQLQRWTRRGRLLFPAQTTSRAHK